MPKKKTAPKAVTPRATNELQELAELNDGVAMLIKGGHLVGVEAQLTEIYGILEMILAVLEKQSGIADPKTKKSSQ